MSKNKSGDILKRLLIIEDDPNTLSGLMELFRDEGYSVKGVSSGQAALGIILREPVDIVLCDYKLPDIDGLVVSRKIKQIKPEVCTFLMTAYYRKNLEEMASFCGILKIFAKPLDIDNLLTNLALLSNKSNYGSENYPFVRAEC